MLLLLLIMGLLFYVILFWMFFQTFPCVGEVYNVFWCRCLVHYQIVTLLYYSRLSMFLLHRLNQKNYFINCVFGIYFFSINIFLFFFSEFKNIILVNFWYGKVYNRTTSEDN